MAVLADQLRIGRRLRSRRGGPVHGEDRVPDEAGRDNGPHQDPENQAHLLRGVTRGRGGFIVVCVIRTAFWSAVGFGVAAVRESDGNGRRAQEAEVPVLARASWREHDYGHTQQADTEPMMSHRSGPNPSISCPTRAAGDKDPP